MSNKTLLYLLLVWCCFIFNACAATAYYSTESDLQFAFNRQEPLTFSVAYSPTIEDKKFGLLLRELMVESGFNIAGFNIKEQQTPCSVNFP